MECFSDAYRDGVGYKECIGVATLHNKVCASADKESFNWMRVLSPTKARHASLQEITLARFIVHREKNKL